MRRHFVFILIFHLTALACSKSPSEPESPKPPQFPNLNLTEITEPTGAPTNVLEFFDDAYERLSFTSSFFDLFENIGPQGRHPDWSWSTDFGGWGMIANASVIGENSVTWKLKWVFDEEASHSWIISTGTSTLDGTSASWEFYEFDTTNLYETCAWLQDEQDVLIVNSYILQHFRKLELTGRPDGRVGLIVKFKEAVIFESEWNATGTGSWISYNYPNGDRKDNGTW